MKYTTTSLVAALVALGVLSPAWAVNLKDKVNVEIESAQFHAGMDPGTYRCAAQHLHIRAVVENRADVRLGRIKVAGKVFDGAARLWGRLRRRPVNPFSCQARQPELTWSFSRLLAG